MENPDMYKGIDNVALQNATVKGNNLHKIIENYELYGTIMTNSPELLNYIEIDGKVICAGRFDLMAEVNGLPALIDFKRTSQIHYDYVKLQLNLYALGLKQSYNEEVKNYL